MANTEFTETICGFGHPNVQATHHSTLEFTRDKELSLNGDCILVISADKGLKDFCADFKATLKKPSSRLTVIIEVDGIIDVIHAKGSTKLSLTDPTEMVLRKSDFSSKRTLGICADKAARDLSRVLVEKLKNSKQKARITLTVQV